MVSSLIEIVGDKAYEKNGAMANWKRHTFQKTCPH